MLRINAEYHININFKLLFITQCKGQIIKTSLTLSQSDDSQHEHNHRQSETRSGHPEVCLLASCCNSGLKSQLSSVGLFSVLCHCCPPASHLYSWKKKRGRPCWAPWKVCDESSFTKMRNCLISLFSMPLYHTDTADLSLLMQCETVQCL